LKLSLRLGFGLLLLCMVVTLGANVAANTGQITSADRLIDHLYPARQQASLIVGLTQAIDNDASWYLLSYNPHQQAQLLQTYQLDIQKLRMDVASATALADTLAQRNALVDFTYYFFGNGGYYASNQQIFAKKQVDQVNQIWTAGDTYVRSPY